MAKARSLSLQGMILLAIIETSFARCMFQDDNLEIAQHIDRDIKNFEKQLNENILKPYQNLWDILNNLSCKEGSIEIVTYEIAVGIRSIERIPQNFWNIDLYLQNLRNITYNFAGILAQNGILNQALKNQAFIDGLRECNIANASKMKDAFYEVLIGLVKFLHPPYRCPQYIAEQLLRKVQHRHTGNYCSKLQHVSLTGSQYTELDEACTGNFENQLKAQVRFIKGLIDTLKNHKV